MQKMSKTGDDSVFSSGTLSDGGPPPARFSAGSIDQSHEGVHHGPWTPTHPRPITGYPPPIVHTDIAGDCLFGDSRVISRNLNLGGYTQMFGAGV